MGKKMKRGKAGNAVQYLTRTRAIRKLQLRLGEFRRLCILKGIHPREPKKKVHGANKTYYHMKDINFLLHEPLLKTFRHLKVCDRKIRKAKAKHNEDLAQRLHSLKPGYKVDHLVKERYPSFMDAIRDLDDPLTMVNLFATLPAEKKYEIPGKAVQMARRLSMEFNAYVVRTHAMRKVFVSIKGFYYQAEILGQSVTWLVPHQLAQVLPADVDYRVMITFLEFYETMLQFVNFKLYHMIGLRYPPSVDPRMESAAEELASIMRDLAGVQGAVDQTVQEQQQQMQQLEQHEASKAKAKAHDDNKEVDEEGEEEEVDSEDDGQDDEDLEIDSGDNEDEGEVEEEEEEASAHEAEDTNGDVLEMLSARRRRHGSGGASTSVVADEGEEAAGGALGVDASDEASLCGALYKGLVFFLAREVPREPLLLVIRAFGGTVAWSGEGSPMLEGDESITHQVVDRPTQGHRFLSRKYVQPQWVLDSANFRVLLPSELYVPGKVPPPHLSPFVNDDEEGYTPDFAAIIKRVQDAAKMARERASCAVKSGDTVFVGDGDEAEALLALEVAGVDDAEAIETTYLADLSKELQEAAGEVDSDNLGEGEEEEDEENEAQKVRQRKPLALGDTPAAKRKADKTAEDADETERMKDIMMTRKNRKLYERIKRAQEGKRSRVEVLETKRGLLVKDKPAVVTASGEMVTKQAKKKSATAARENA